MKILVRIERRWRMVMVMMETTSITSSSTSSPSSTMELLSLPSFLKPMMMMFMMTPHTRMVGLVANIHVIGNFLLNILKINLIHFFLLLSLSISPVHLLSPILTIILPIVFPFLSISFLFFLHARSIKELLSRKHKK